MGRKIRIGVTGLLVLLVVVVLVFVSSNEAVVSSDQQQVIDLMGNPAQFVITYLPQKKESGEQYARFETWYYPDDEKKLTFVSGTLVDSESYVFEEPVEMSPFVPWDFDIYTTYDQIQEKLQSLQLSPLEVEGFFDDQLQTYASTDLVLIIEGDFLTYVQTVTFDDSPVMVEESLKTYANSDLGFSLQYPQAWTIQNGVLATYNLDTQTDEATAVPEEALKCDFLPLAQAKLQLINQSTISTEPLSIIQANAIEPEDDMGMGDNTIFLVSDSQHQDPLAVVCFLYHPSKQAELVKVLQTITFLD